eukprot:4791094-Heterocapsa_arctica.AAC.1
MIVIIGMFSAGRCRLASGTRLRRPRVVRGARVRPPGLEGDPRHVPCVQAPVGFAIRPGRPFQGGH